MLFTQAHSKPSSIITDISAPLDVGLTKRELEAYSSVFDLTGAYNKAPNGAITNAALGSSFKQNSLDVLQSTLGRPHIYLVYLPLNPDLNIGPGEKKALRVYRGGSATIGSSGWVLTGANKAVLYNGNDDDVFGWAWMLYDYSESGKLTWTENGTVKYSGYPGQKVGFSFVFAYANCIFSIDVGRKGGSPPDGYSWAGD